MRLVCVRHDTAKSYAKAGVGREIARVSLLSPRGNGGMIGQWPGSMRPGGGHHRDEVRLCHLRQVDHDITIMREWKDGRAYDV